MAPGANAQGLSARAVCREYGLDRGTVRDAIASGELPAARFGERRFLILRGDVESWIRSHAIRPSDHEAARVGERLEHEARMEAG